MKMLQATMHRLGFAALLLLMSPGIPVSALALLRGTDVHQIAAEQPNAFDVPATATVSINTTVDGSDEDEHDDALVVWKSGRSGGPVDSRGLPYGSGSLLPPKCPADVSETSPYMTENVFPNKYYTMCDYRQPCGRRGTNLERVDSIRGLLKQTKKLLNDLQVPYALYGGSAVGQERCGDVLPWDSDCDVVVWEHDVHKISSGNIDSRYAVQHKTINSAVPFVVADRKTGFFCDIFFMKRDPKFDSLVNMAWPWGASDCYDMSTSSPFTGEIKKCDKFPMSVVSPFVPCVLNGIEHTCFKDQAGFLELRMGRSVLHLPDVPTQAGGGKRSVD